MVKSVAKLRDWRNNKFHRVIICSLSYILNVGVSKKIVCHNHSVETSKLQEQTD